MPEKNPLEQLPSSRRGSQEMPASDGGEYKEVIDEQFKEDNDGSYHNQYPKKVKAEEIPDEDSLLPDEFEDKENEVDLERDAYIDKYNEEHKDQYALKRSYKEFGNVTQHAEVTYQKMRNGRLKPMTHDTKPEDTTVRKVA